MEGEVLAQVGLDQVVQHEGGQAIAPPGWVHCQVGEVRLAPPGKDKIVQNNEKNENTQAFNDTNLQSGTTSPNPTQSLL